jgi:hypothetical protein
MTEAKGRELHLLWIGISLCEEDEMAGEENCVGSDTGEMTAEKGKAVRITYKKKKKAPAAAE